MEGSQLEILSSVDLQTVGGCLSSPFLILWLRQRTDSAKCLSCYCLPISLSVSEEIIRMPSRTELTANSPYSPVLVNWVTIVRIANIFLSISFISACWRFPRWISTTRQRRVSWPGGTGAPSIKWKLSTNLRMCGDGWISMWELCKTKRRMESFMCIKR